MPDSGIKAGKRKTTLETGEKMEQFNMELLSNENKLVLFEFKLSLTLMPLSVATMFTLYSTQKKITMSKLNKMNEENFLYLSLGSDGLSQGHSVLRCGGRKAE